MLKLTNDSLNEDHNDTDCWMKDDYYEYDDYDGGGGGDHDDESSHNNNVLFNGDDANNNNNGGQIVLMKQLLPVDDNDDYYGQSDQTIFSRSYLKQVRFEASQYHDYDDDDDDYFHNYHSLNLFFLKLSLPGYYCHFSRFFSTFHHYQ